MAGGAAVSADVIACPAWCTDHESEEGFEAHNGAIGDMRLRHVVRAEENPEGYWALTRWGAGGDCEEHGDTAAELAERLRVAAEDLVTAAEWAEEHQ
jgi:hypothetical protein